MHTGKECVFKRSVRGRQASELAGAAGASRALAGSLPLVRLTVERVTETQLRPCVCLRPLSFPSLSASCTFRVILLNPFPSSYLECLSCGQPPDPSPAPQPRVGCRHWPLRCVRAVPSPALGSHPPHTCRVWRGAAVGPPGPLPYTLPSPRLDPVSVRGAPRPSAHSHQLGGPAGLPQKSPCPTARPGNAQGGQPGSCGAQPDPFPSPGGLVGHCLVSTASENTLLCVFSSFAFVVVVVGAFSGRRTSVLPVPPSRLQVTSQNPGGVAR